MKKVVAVALVALLTAVARADWKDLKRGMDTRAAWQCAGIPLMESKGRGAAEAWTYDQGGYILLERGQVVYWEAPRSEKAAAAAAAARQAKAEPKKTVKPTGKVVAAN